MHTNTLPRCRLGRETRGQRGIALILVTFIIALATIVVVNLTYSTYLSARSNAVVERSLYAEYLLKSTVNLAIALIKADPDQNKDGPLDEWAKFANGIPLPPELLGLEEQNMTIEVEITPENQKFPVRTLINRATNAPDPAARDRIARLFQELGFDSDTKEVPQSGMFAGAFFDSKALVANLIDYMDPDSDSYQDPNFTAGIEANLPKDSFPNRVIDRVSELAGVPGFTPHRMQVLEPFLTANDDSRINVNFAPPQVLAALDPLIGSRQIEDIIEYRGSPQGPFSYSDGKFAQVINDSTLYNNISPIIGYNSRYFTIIAKVEFGTQAFFARALITRDGGTNNAPDIHSLEMF